MTWFVTVLVYKYDYRSDSPISIHVFEPGITARQLIIMAQQSKVSLVGVLMLLMMMMAMVLNCNAQDSGM